MKKFILASMCAVAMVGALPISAQEVTYVEDCSQGLLFNRHKDNWFITAQGGANFTFGKYADKAPNKDRFGASAAIFAGKWISPVFGIRFGFSMTESKSAGLVDDPYRDDPYGPFSNGYYPRKYFGYGVQFDVMVNLTNWIMGYKPNRVYSLVAHGGAASMWCLQHDLKGGKKDWTYDFHNRIFYMDLGLQNNFRISDAFDVFIDANVKMVDWSQLDYVVGLQAGLTYKFKKREWNCPVTAVCPTWKYTDAEGDALQARLAAADGRINDLQNQLDDCLNRPKEVANDCDMLATVYYPINVSSLGKREHGILNSVAEVMMDKPNQKYVLCGWADNYTGNDEINVRLRHARVEGVKNYLVNRGVNPDQLEVTIDNNNLTDFGLQGASLDRAVTIKEAR